MYESIKIDVRNIKPLTKAQLDYIKTKLKKEELLELIDIYNECVVYVENVINYI
jgi:hypothetical protein